MDFIHCLLFSLLEFLNSLFPGSSHVHLHFNRALIISRNLQVISKWHFYFHISAMVYGANCKLSVTLSFCLCLMPPSSSQSHWVFISLGSWIFLWGLFILHPPDSQTDILHRTSFGNSQMWGAKSPYSRKKKKKSWTEVNRKLVCSCRKEKWRLCLGDFHGMMRCELLGNLFHFSFSVFASSSPFFSRQYIVSRVFIVKFLK